MSPCTKSETLISISCFTSQFSIHVNTSRMEQYFSTKVGRTAQYTPRFLARNILPNGNWDKCDVHRSTNQGDTLLTRNISACADGILKRTCGQSEDGTQTLAASSKVSMKDDTCRRQAGRTVRVCAPTVQG